MYACNIRYLNNDRGAAKGFAPYLHAYMAYYGLCVYIYVTRA